MLRRQFMQNLAIGAGAIVLSPKDVLARTFSRSTGEADWIYKGGLIYTANLSNPTAEAVAVRGNQIVYVGDAKAVLAWMGPTTHVVDLDGGMLMPGFVDAHAHPELGVTKVGLNIVGVNGREAILDCVKDYLAQNPGSGVLRGFGWNPGALNPKREWLDAITGDRPMYLLSFDAHDIWFNTAAMKMAGIGSDTPDPTPGSQYFVRDTNGVPTGHGVEGGAVMRVAIPLGIVSPENVHASQALTLDPAPSWGVTSLFNAGVVVGEKSQDAQWVYEGLIKRDQSGNLPIRIKGCVWTREGSNNPKMIANNLKDWNENLRSPHLEINVCKMWSDGTLLSHGALLLDPFLGSKDDYGRMTFTKEEIIVQTIETQKAGFDMHIHTDADGSVRNVLDALEQVQNQIGLGNSRHTIAHNSLVSPADIPRYKNLHVIANCEPMWGTNYNGNYIETYNKTLGSKRTEERVFPYGDLVRSGAVVSYGSDIPGIEIADIPPLINLQAAVTRRRPGYPDDPAFIERQKVSLAQALQCYTYNSAYQMRLDGEVGSIEVGKKADLVFLEKNLFRVDPSEIYKTKILQTMMDGTVTHSLL